MNILYKNVPALEAWLKENLKSKSYDILAFLDDVEKQYFETGAARYELSRFESKSGKPECFEFEAINYFGTGDELVETTITF